jgi:hypothetical protein
MLAGQSVVRVSGGWRAIKLVMTKESGWRESRRVDDAVTADAKLKVPAMQGNRSPLKCLPAPTDPGGGDSIKRNVPCDIMGVCDCVFLSLKGRPADSTGQRGAPTAFLRLGGVPLTSSLLVDRLWGLVGLRRWRL